MRQFTENDRRGLFVAFRRFINTLNGQRIYEKSGLALVDKALEAGLTLDELFNKENYGRACEVSPDASADTYIQLMADMQIEVRSLTEEKMWHDPDNGFALVAECAHEFFMSVTGKGGRWNIPSALTCLAKAVKDNTLQGVLSDINIQKLRGDAQQFTFFNYIEILSRDFNNTLGLDNSLSGEQEERIGRMAELANQAMAGDGDGDASGEESEMSAEEIRNMQELEKAQHALINPDGDDEDYTGPISEPDLDTYRDYDDDMMDGGEEESAQFTSFIVRESPQERKTSAISVMLNTSFNITEMQHVARLVNCGENLSLVEIVQKLADGDLSAGEKDDPVLRSLHQTMNTLLTSDFVECVKLQGVPMTAEAASNYDIIRASWDLRDPSVRKLHKTKQLVYSYGMDDPELIEMLADLERLYSE